MGLNIQRFYIFPNNKNGMIDENNNLEKRVGGAESYEEEPINYPSKCFQYIAAGVLPVIQAGYFIGGAYALDNILTSKSDVSEVVGYTFPLVFATYVAGAFLIREGYVRAIRTLTNHANSSRNNIT